MKIAIYLPSLQGGGAERVSLLLAQGFVQKGAQVDLVLASAEGPHLRSVSPGVNVVDLKARRVLMSLPPLVTYLRRRRPEVMISSLSHANVIAIFAKKIAGNDTRVFVVEHVVPTASSQLHATTRSKLTLWLMPRVYPFADTVLAVSQGVAEELVRDFGLPREKVWVVYNPVVGDDIFAKAQQPLEHPWFKPGAPPVFLAVGRLAKEKNFGMLVRAFSRVLKNLDSRLLILGEGPERPYLEDLVRKLGLSEYVSLPGFEINPYRYMARASALVLSSIHEALPTVLIEALALGTPVVATDCPYGPAEILEGGRWGKLVNVDDEEAMAKAMMEAVVDPPSEEEKRLARESALKRFGVNEGVERYWRLIVDAERKYV